jgi:hypothetical protein
MEPRFVAVERDGHLIGGAPLVIARRAGFHWIHALPFLLPALRSRLPACAHEVDAAVRARSARSSARCVRWGASGRFIAGRSRPRAPRW